MYKIGPRMLEALEKEKSIAFFENLYIYVTNECNMHCKHCYLGNRLIKKEIMSLDDVFKHLKFWRNLGASKVCFLGGEPSLYVNLKESVTYAHSLKYEKVIINSNLSEKALNVICSYTPNEFNYIQTSLDGATKGTHELIRGKGTFDQTVKSIKSLLANGHDIRVIMTVNQWNKHEVIDMIRLTEDLGCSLVKFHIMSEIGNADKSLNVGISPLEWLEICKEIRNFANVNIERKIRISYQPSYASHTEQDPLIENYKGCVGLNKERISVFPDGKCYICSFLFDSENGYARVINNEVELVEDALDGNFYNERCDTCNNSCGYNGCLAENYVYGNEFCDANRGIYPICRLWKIEI